MKTESMLVRSLAKLVISTDDINRKKLRDECERLLNVLEMHGGSSSNNDMALIVTDIIKDIGIPANIAGYRYVKEAIILAVSDRSIMKNMQKELYPMIATKFNTTPSCVERSIRYAIETAWYNGDIDTIKYYFGNTVSIHKGKPTNSEFISMIVEHINVIIN